MARTMMTLRETIHRHADVRSACPCCGQGAGMDQPATRYRLLRPVSGAFGDQLEIARSVDGGRTWFGAGWHPLANVRTVALLPAEWGVVLEEVAP